MKSIDIRRVWLSILSSLVMVLIILLLLSLSAASPFVAVGLAQKGSVPCLNRSDTLEDLVECINEYMPHRFSVDGRDGFEVPTATQKTQWREVVEQMMEGECGTINLRGYDWGDDFVVTVFTDIQKSHTYCIFMETTYDTYPNPAGDRVTHGWGTFIYDPTYLRDLNFSAPHAKYERGTDTEAVGIFQNSQGRTFLMTGAHRYASDVDSGCQGDYKRSDAAHNTDHMFHATVAELEEYYGNHNSEFYHLQFHGMGSSTCPDVDVYMTHGTSAIPAKGDKILELKVNLVSHNPDWTVTVPGDSLTCTLHGNTNVQGRLINAVPGDQICDTSASGYSGYFIHIEQHTDYRSSNDWISAINDTWPVCYSPLVVRNFNQP